MTENYPITLPSELVQQWAQLPDDWNTVAFHIAQWGADQQLEQDAKWLDSNALFSNHLTITPSGDALRQVMRPKPPSLKEQALALLDKAEDPSWDINDFTIVRRALEQLDD